MKRWYVGIAFLFGSSVALAALPPPTPQQAEAAELAKAKTAYANVVANYQLCQAINAVANKYRTAGTPPPGPCTAPPPFTPPATAAVAHAPAAAPVKK